MKVYVVECSYIDDISLEGIFSTEEKAEAYAKLMNDKNIEYHYYYFAGEWTVDEDNSK